MPLPTRALAVVVAAALLFVATRRSAAEPETARSAHVQPSLQPSPPVLEAVPMYAAASVAWAPKQMSRVRASALPELGSPVPDALSGFCAITDGAGDCATGSSGSWSGARNLSACAGLCERCARCRFVSFSPSLNDCSWYAVCPRLSSAARGLRGSGLGAKPATRLLQEPRGFTTVGVPAGREALHPPPRWRSASAALPDRAARGYCSVTVGQGDCALGDSGVLAMGGSGRVGAVSTFHQCRVRCVACARCAVVSFSEANADCSWYAACDLADLRRPPREAPDYVSMRIREAPPPVLPAAAAVGREPPPEPRGRGDEPPRGRHARRPARHSDRPGTRPVTSRAGVRPSLAIATLAVPPAAKPKEGHAPRGAAPTAPWERVAVGCALLQWCERAALLARAVRSEGWTVSTLLLGAANSSLADCSAGATVVPVPPRLPAAMGECGRSRADARASHDVTMLKWSVCKRPTARVRNLASARNLTL